MLINLTNHPSSRWDSLQTDAARREFSTILDYQFPYVSTAWDTAEVAEAAERVVNDCLTILANTGPGRHAVHIMGEMTLSFAIVALLQKAGVLCLASATERIVRMEGPRQESYFAFVAFRAYPELCL